MKRIAALSLLLLFANAARAANGLRVVSAGPQGEVQQLSEANEVRVSFSEPMVVLGKIPATVTAPFFKIEPQVAGTFRWAGTTTLIFTPSKPLPYATKFDVTIDTTAKSVAGKTLDKPYRFSFTTPTVRLTRVDWYRKGGLIKNGVVVMMQFNQPVDPNTIIQHLSLRTAPRTIQIPDIPPEGVEELKKREPQALQAFEAKKAKALQNAASSGAQVLSFLATDWDKKRWEPARDRVVLETKPNVQPDTMLQIFLDNQLAQGANRVRTGRAQQFNVELEPTLFVESISCRTKCDPDDRNAITFRTTYNGISYEKAGRAITVTDITDPAKPVPLQAETRERNYDYPTSSFSLDELGFSLAPARRYLVRIDPSLQSEDGQTLGYTWMTTVENTLRSAFVSFGSGHGVWETSGGSVVPLHVRNFRSVKQWLAPITADRLMPTIRELQRVGFNSVPPNAKVQERKLNLPVDKIHAIGLDVSSVIGKDGRGLVWAAMEPGETVPGAQPYTTETRATIVQVTNLGISVKDSPQNTLILVTRLDDAKPVAGATVSIRHRDNKVVWTGTTDEKGIAIAPTTDLRRIPPEKKQGEEEYGEEEYWRSLSELHFLVIAEKDGDVAYVGSDWNEGITPWELGTGYDISEARPLLRGTVFTDRGVYKLGEEAHLKAIVRSDTPNGMKLLPSGTKVELVIRDSHAREVDKRTVTLNDWSSADWTFKVPEGGALGTYSIYATVPGNRLEVFGSFLVAAYRRPEFRVDAKLDAPNALAGVKLDGRVTGRYLFGAPMAGRDVSWTYSKRPIFSVPQAVTDRWPWERYTFLGWDESRPSRGKETISQQEAKLDAKGELKLSLDTELAAGIPYEYQLEGVVTDVTRQQIAGRTSIRVEAAPWYIGVKTPSYFAEAQKGLDTEIVAAGIDGLAVAGVPVKIELKRIQWNSVRQSEGGGYYGWETERKEIAAGEWTITTQAQPVPLKAKLESGGFYELTASARDKAGRSTQTKLSFYAVGEGYTAWERYDHNRIDLVPERTNYKPGDTARIMVKSPWENATALLTTEREGVRTWREFQLTSTQQTITVPLTEADIPNVYVSVLLLKGRTQQDPGKDGSDPGKPAFRLGYTELLVDDEGKRLKVDVKANRDEFRPAAKAKIEVNVKDAAGKPAPSEITLWAVDYGVLSLTGYQTPDVLESIYLHKELQVINEDSRQRIISRRVLEPKGAGEGGGGGRDPGPGTLRKDFRVLAFWVGSIITDKNGRARTEITLPESLTTYRIMAVAADKQSRFGWAQNEIRINKPLMLTPAFPRFLAAGDKALFGGVVHNQAKTGGPATVTIKSLDPSVIAFAEEKSTITVPPGGSAEVRFNAEAKSLGTARVQMRVTMGRENDAFEDVIPVRLLESPETAAAYGTASPTSTETLELPKNVLPGYGGMTVELASTAMVGLSEGARYLVEYPYGCGEQKSSRTLALMLVSELGQAFELPGIDAKRGKEYAQGGLRELADFQCASGGFSFWAGECTMVSPYLTANIVHVLHRGRTLGYTVDKDVLERAYSYLEQNLAEPRPENEGFMPSYTSWQAFSVKVLAEGGRNVDSHINRLHGYADRMPVFGIAFLADALVAKKERGARLDDLHRRLTNAVLPEAGTAHVEELKDPYLAWFWSSNVRSTAIVLGTLVRHGENKELVTKMVRWLMRARKGERWDNTQENAWALSSLIDYYRKYESEVPDFTAVVLIGQEALVREPFKGRQTDAKSRQIPMNQVLAKGTPGQQLPVVFTREGTGTLFWMMRLRYATSLLRRDALNAGFHVERSYRLQNGKTNATSFKAGDLIEVTVRLRNTKERKFVAVTDPIPAGTEPVETWFATTATALVEHQSREEHRSWRWWERGGFDHVERHDDHVNLFATRLSEGSHEFTYLVRATTAGTFTVSPTHAEEMYEPEVFGRNATTTVEVKP